MSKKVQTSLDFGRNQILNAVIQNLASAPGTVAEGLVYYDTGTKKFNFYNGTIFIDATSRANHTGTQTWATITGTPTTLAGYGITDGGTSDWGDLTGTPTTIAGYGITDAYTIAQVDTALAGKTTTAYVDTAIANLVDSSPGTLDTLNELAAALGDDPNFATTLTNSIALKAPLASPTFTGIPAAPTATLGTNTTQLATTAFVQEAVTEAASGIAKIAFDIGDNVATSFVLTHNLNSRDVSVTVRNNATPYDEIIIDVAMTSVNTVTVSGFATAPTENQYRAIIIG